MDKSQVDKNKVRVDLLREWRQERLEDGIRFSYPVPEEARGFYPRGFVRESDSAADFVDWHGLFLTVREGFGTAREQSGTAREREAAEPETYGDGQASGVLAQLQVAVFFAEEEPLRAEIPVPLRSGEAAVEVPFTYFPQELAREKRFEFVTAVEVAWPGRSLELAECAVRRRPGLFVHMPVKGKAGEAGENICYRGTVYNCTSEELTVTADQVFEGWESLIAEVRLGQGEEGSFSAHVPGMFCDREGDALTAGPGAGASPAWEAAGRRNAPAAGQEAESAGLADTGRGILLAPGEGAPITVTVTVDDYMVPGGHENTVIRVRGQGSRGSFQDSAELKTLRRLPHPYLYHDAAAWRKAMENIQSYEPFREDYGHYREIADAWAVEDPLPGRPFCYETKTEEAVMSSAYLYALTGERGYAEKLADFFRRFSDSADGYPARKRGCSQSYVQEGHFFKHLAVAYDIICDGDVLTCAGREAVEGCFRLYMEMLDKHVRDGRISNWLLSELQGALFCALALQDMDRALRFVFGRGGILEQFSCGIFNDGWWHECSVGYNTWVSSIMLHTAHALVPFGYDLGHACFRIPFNKEVSSTYRGEAPKVDFGMYNQKWGGNRKPAMCIKDMFDATLPFLDYRGVLFGIADSDEKKLSGAHFGSTYDLAYQYYGDEQYLSVIAKNAADCIFGEPGTHKRALAGEAGRETKYSWTDDGGDGKEVPGSGAGSSGKGAAGELAACASPMGNAFADNIGLAMLRSQKSGRPQREQIQAVLRYGSHGNAHGHFDVTDLLSVMRYGRSFFNPENCWWGYAHFMYKFYVQCSLTKNMVAVDEKMQNPADSRRILWQSGEGLQAAGIEVRAKWSYPPYGGMVYTQDGQTVTKEELRRRCRMNGCFLPIMEGEGSPGYGELTGFTEPILQRRVMAVTDDYIVLFDYVKGEKEHCYDSLMQIKGFLGIEGGSVKRTHHTEQMNPNPVSDAQFITDCDWYEVDGNSVARFRTVFTEEHAGERLVCDRSNYNEPGVLNMDVYTAWPRRTEQMVGRVAVYEGWAADGNGYTIPLSYHVELDQITADEGAFDGWILGRGEVALDVKGVSQAVLSLKQGAMHNEIGEPIRTPQGVFWGEICLELEDGMVINLGQRMKEPASGIDQDGAAWPGREAAGSEESRSLERSRGLEESRNLERSQGLESRSLERSREHGGAQARESGRRWSSDRIRMENVDSGCGIGRDYKGGRVTIVGTEYPYALGASPVNHEEESRIILNLEGLGAVRLTACVGVDAFPGDEWQKRKTYAVRCRGALGRFVTVIEPYEEEPVIAAVTAESPDCIQVALRDGRAQTITLTGMEEGRPQVGLR